MLSSTSKHCSQRLIEVFNRCFAASPYHTRLCGGGDEPVYLPATSAHTQNTIIFTKDYFSSALHEVSHWCIAGEARRREIDYGYWYAPDGRTRKQQTAFERVEVKPQALEWIFHRACQRRFRVSADNLALGLGPSDMFKNNIFIQTLSYCERGLNTRAAQFAAALATQFGGNDYLDRRAYCKSELE